jgi:hypothetical protein
MGMTIGRTKTRPAHHLAGVRKPGTRLAGESLFLASRTSQTLIMGLGDQTPEMVVAH